jgi:hypothetical protein
MEWCEMNFDGAEGASSEVRHDFPMSWGTEIAKINVAIVRTC